jgi:hypothetical protein
MAIEAKGTRPTSGISAVSTDVRYRSPNGASYLVVVYLLMMVGLWIGLLLRQSWGWFIFFSVFDAFYVPAMVSLFLQYFRSVTIRGGVIHIQGWFKVITLPMAEIAGVGLVHTRRVGRGPGPAWVLEFWKSDGKTCRAPSIRRANFKKEIRALQDAGATLPINKKGKPMIPLIQSKLGGIAEDIYQRTLAHQGPMGPISLQPRPSPTDSPPSGTDRWWSPRNDLNKPKSPPGHHLCH